MLSNSSVLSNSASSNGGGISNQISGRVTLAASSVLSSSANAGGGISIQINGSVTLDASSVMSNSATAVAYLGGTAPITATDNWWGHASGPAGAGPGIGDSVSADVNFNGFLGAAILGCPTFGDPDLAIAKAATPTLVAPGGAMANAHSVITYTVSFSNTGTATADSVTISDSVPVSVTITGVTSSTVGTGGVFIAQTSGSPNFAWAVSDLAVGAGGNITLTGVVAGDAWTGLVITNTATITSSGDSNGGNNSGSAAVTVARLDVYPAQPGVLPGVSVPIRATLTPAQAGVQVNFTVVSGGGGVANASATTDASGVATVLYTAPGSAAVAQIEGSLANAPGLRDRAIVYVAAEATAGAIARSTGGSFTIGNLSPNHIQFVQQGSGTPLLGWAEFAGNPCPTTPPGSNVVSPYVDAMVEDVTDVSAIVVTLRYTGTVGDASQYEPFWCNNGTWEVVAAPLTVDTAASTLVFTLTGTTSPTLHQLDGTPFAGVGPLGPTAVTVDWFAAAGQPGRAQLTWQTVNEVGLYGFHLYRGLDPAAPGERITAEPLPAQGMGSLQGFAYACEDIRGQPAATVYYWLEELHSDGPAILHGPALVTSAQLLPRLYLPLVSQ